MSKERQVVDCMAYDPGLFMSGDSGSQRVGLAHNCYHPDLIGDQRGGYCSLAYGEACCDFKTPHGSREAEELIRRIKEDQAEKNPQTHSENPVF